MFLRRVHALTIVLVILTQVLNVLPAPHSVLYAAKPAEINAGTVSNCSNDAELDAKLAAGGAINFNCGVATITVSGTKTIAVDTTIDGGNQITLSGGDLYRIFLINPNVTLTLRNITLTKGYANGDGGAIFGSQQSSLVVVNSIFRGNHISTNYSGGAIITYGDATIRDSRFEGNSGGGAGAFYSRWGDSESMIENTVFENNHALNDGSGWGGAILLWDGAQLTLRDSQLEGNTAYNDGGAVVNTFNSELIIERTVITGNQAGFSGGAIRNYGSLQLTDTVIEANEAQIFGGGITNTGGNLQADRVRILGNKILDLEDDAYGGGIYNHTSGVVRLTDSTLAGNIAGRGGGVYSDFETNLILDAVTISGHSTESGGGVYSRGTTKITSSTFSGNNSGASGGAIHVDAGTIDVAYSTFSGNGEGANNSIYFAPDATNNHNFVGTLVSGSCSSPNTGSLGFNLESGNSCGFDTASDKRNTAPNLGPLADNGGATLTHAPNAGSAAINAGGEGCPFIDQRGFLRPTQGLCEIGAVEVAPPPLSVTPFPPTDDPLIGGTPEPEVTPAAPATPPPIVHSKLPNGVAPTIAVSPQAGAAGASINISGKSPSGFRQLRIVSMLDGRTMGMVPVTADEAGNYSLQFTIPDSTRPGPIEVCAVVVGTENANFACAPLQIQPPPPATVEGKLPLAVTVDKAQFQLTNAAGRPLYTSTVGSDLSFSLNNVTPGVYGYRVVGNVSRTIIGGVAKIDPAKKFSPDLSTTVDCAVITRAITTGGVYVNPSRSSHVTQRNALGVTEFSGLRTILGGGGLPRFDPDSRPIGLYVSGVQTNVTFEAEPQANGPVQQVIFEFFNRDSKRVGDAVTVNGAPWRTVFNVGRLSPSSGNRHPYVRITPVVNGAQQCPYLIDIEVIANPFQIAGVQPNALVWDAAKGLYLVQGIIPHIPGILPADFRLPPSGIELPFLGHFDNRLNAGIQVVGTLDLEGQVHLQAIRTVNHVYLMDNELIPPNWQITLMRPNVRVNIANLRETQFPFGPYSLLPDDLYIGLPFTEVPVISFFGLVDVTVNASAGMGADVLISGYVKPLKPEVAATVTGIGRAHAELGVGIRLLAGLARAGATSRLDAELNVPFTVYLDSSPDAEVDACLTFRFSVRAYASAGWGIVEKNATKEVAKWSGCVSEIAGVAALEQEQEPSVPDVLAAPAIAIGTNGTQVTAYVQNNAAAGATPQVQVMARLRFANQAEWSQPVALSNGAFSADAPVVALVGPEQWPLVAWAEKKLTFAEAQSLAGNFNAILQRQEIVYRLYRNGQWEPAVYLTTDDQSSILLGDGLPALAGGTGGAVLAWTRDLDGDWLTRADQRIAVTTFDVATATFAPFSLLRGGGPGLNGDVKVAWDAANNRPYLVWVFDEDADLNSAGDRRLALAYFDNLEWVLLNPQPLPPRVDSPAITVGPDGVQLAFLVREPDMQGTVSVVGTNGVLWTAKLANGEWVATPVLDANKQPIWGEEPVLATHGAESLLLFRRFGQADDNSRFGQLALSRIVGKAQPTMPLYMTDEPRQNWQGQLTINPVSGLAQIVRVSRAALDIVSVADANAFTSIASTQAIAASQEVMISNAADPVSMLSYAITADPALDSLRVSTQAPQPGQSFTISATTRNVGRGDAAGVVVRLYAGLPGSGTLLQTSAPLPTLPFNTTATTAFSIQATGGEQAFYAEVVASGAESSADNNRAAIVVGQLSKPVIVEVVESIDWIDGLEVNWIAPKDEVILGYRILRSSAAKGPFDLVGESSIPGFTDVPLTRNETYCYAVQSYNATTFSARSEAICAALPPAAETGRAIFMPFVQR